LGVSVSLIATPVVQRSLPGRTVSIRQHSVETPAFRDCLDAQEANSKIRNNEGKLQFHTFVMAMQIGDLPEVQVGL
jgi:hypothetical protein